MSKSKTGIKLLAAAAALTALTACTVGPNYVRPTAEVPPSYKEIKGWKTAEPKEAAINEHWWEMYGDPELTALEVKVNISNQNIKVAEAQYRQARALVLAARAAYWPTVTIGAGFTRSQAPYTVSNGQLTPASAYSLPLSVSWAPDIWGKIRRTVEANQANAQASAADLAAASLSYQTELAQDYFQMRSLDSQKRLLDRTVVSYQKFLELTKNQYEQGIASMANVLQAQTQLKTTQAQAIDVGVQRAQMEHAVALLIGTPASVFSLPLSPLDITPPPIPIGVPSELLERRPDIAAAERLVASANAQIGVAISAYYPTVTLSASGGFESSSLSKWLSWPSRFWSVGPSISETVFDGGLRRAQTDQARAVYDANVASYRETTLAAFQNVEDNLAALRILEDEAKAEDEAVKAAQQTVVVTTNEYNAGTLSYLNIITAQAAELGSEITAIGILGRRLTSSVLLIEALGGGWDASELPPAKDLNKRQQPAAK
ncbi:MAG: efflux transporter outer membrane subunit [Nitrospirota bacterium]